jgi:hypothetical protein
MPDVIATLTARLGPPSADWSQEAPFEEEALHEDDMRPCFFATGGYACFDFLGTVQWEDVGLWLVFADVMVRDGADRGDDDYYVRVEPNLRGYSYRAGDTSVSLSTVEGLTTGSSVADLLDLYGDAVRFSLDCGEADITYFVADPEARGDRGFAGWLQGEDPQAFVETDQVNSDATVTSIAAGMAWTPC